MKSKLFLLFIFFSLILTCFNFGVSGYGELSEVKTSVNIDDIISQYVSWSCSYSSVNVPLNLNYRDVGTEKKLDIGFSNPTLSSQSFVIKSLISVPNIIKYEYIGKYRIDFYCKDFSFYYDWSDLVNISNVVTSYDMKGNAFTFNISVSSVSAKSNVLLDPKYGVITSTALSSYEYDTTYSLQYNLNTLVRLNSSNYFLDSSLGSGAGSNDGVLFVFYVNPDTGIVTSSIISTYTYDSVSVQYCNIYHVPNSDMYAVVYLNYTSNKVTIKTFKVLDTTGIIQGNPIDTQALTYSGEKPIGLFVTNNVLAVAYQETTSEDGFIETVWIDLDGQINGTLLDIEEFETSYLINPFLCVVDTDTIAVTYSAVAHGSGGDFTVKTLNITSAGLISSYADTWVYEASPMYHNQPLIKVGSNVFDVTYVDSANDVQTKTFYINDWDITASFIDTLTIVAGAEIYSPQVFTIHDAFYSADGTGIYGATICGVGAGEEDGYLYIWNCTSSGAMDVSIISSLEYETTTQTAWSIVKWVNQSYYLIVYGESGLDGRAKTYFITTNWATPEITLNSPTNYEMNVEAHPVVNVSVSDLNGDQMIVTFEAYIGTEYVIKQVNVSDNGTVRWHYTDATDCGTFYTYRVSVFDGLHNDSYVYGFYTASCVPYCPSQSYNYTNHSLTYYIDINVSNGDFDYNISCFVNDRWFSNNGTNGINGTYSLFIYNLSENVTYYIYCNISGTICLNKTVYEVNLSFGSNVGECDMSEIGVESSFLELLIVLGICFMIYKVNLKYFYIHIILAMFGVFIIFMDWINMLALFGNVFVGGLILIGLIIYMLFMGGMKLEKGIKALK